MRSLLNSRTPQVASYQRELKEMLHLALPVIASEVGWITMAVVDSISVSALGPGAIGAVSAGSTLFFAVVAFAIGSIYALDTFVSQSFGARRIDECHRWLFAGLHLAAALSVVTVAAGLVLAASLDRAGVNPSVIGLLRPYFSTLMWSAPPLMAFWVFRRYLQAMDAVRPIMFALLAANVVNAVGNWVFVYGHLGVPAFGVIGSAYATFVARLVLAGSLLGVILVRERRQPSGLHDVPWTIDWPRVLALTRLGVPAALQVTLEVGVFATASLLAARLTPIALAANQVVLTIVSFFFMVPLGVSSAAAVRVGQAIGRGDAAGARVSGWTAIGLACGVGLALSAYYFAAAWPLTELFSRDTALLSLSGSVLAWAALSVPFDSVQTVATGALRGLGDTHSAMIVNLGFHWFVGLPLAWWLCFSRGWGVAGLWAGLGVSLFSIGSLLSYFWYLRSSAPSLVPRRIS